MTERRQRHLLSEGLTDTAVALAAAGFAALWRRQARLPRELLPRHPDADDVARILAGRGRAELDDLGGVVGIHGLTLRETRHHFVHDGRRHHTWCAFDSIGIPAALRIDAVAYTDCPTCGRNLTITLVDGVPTDHRDLVLWLPNPVGRHLISEFCATADLYCSHTHLEERIDITRTAGETVALGAATSLARDTWSDVADVLQLSWPPVPLLPDVDGYEH